VKTFEQRCAYQFQLESAYEKSIVEAEEYMNWLRQSVDDYWRDRRRRAALEKAQEAELKP